ncbi:S49 family peptidase [Rhodopila sp.]|uniref:S49 family peptidase n=1 Tax=Rhodopila sp. TaxID=2480087 RepID=UPI003D0E6BD5
MSGDFAFLSARVFNTPLMLTEAKAEIIMAALAERLGVTQLSRGDGAAVAMAGYALDSDAAPERPYGITPEGVAIIPIQGTLIQRGALHPYSGMTSYSGIRCKFLGAMADEDVRGIVLDIDSPGGEVAGVFDLADTILAARGVKPIWAILNESAYSAAYCLASAADTITVPRTGGAGSIGVIAMCVDLSRALDQQGITVNVIAHGKRKADGNQFQPLAKEARDRFQADVDSIGALFEATVARNRGIAVQAVRDTEAGTFQGPAAVALKLADRVAAPDEAFDAFLQRL